MDNREIEKPMIENDKPDTENIDSEVKPDDLENVSGGKIQTEEDPRKRIKSVGVICKMG